MQYFELIQCKELNWVRVGGDHKARKFVIAQYDHI